MATVFAVAAAAVLTVTGVSHTLFSNRHIIAVQVRAAQYGCY